MPRESEAMPNVRLIHADALDALKEMPDKSVDLVFGSPPYAMKGERYGQTGEAVSHKWGTGEWTDWLLAVSQQAARISRGRVGWVANAPMVDGDYQPCVEDLIVFLSCAEEPFLLLDRPCIWVKNATNAPKGWFRNSWEYIVWFRDVAITEPYFNWEAVANPPVYSAGGKYSHREATGKRTTRGGDYPTPKLVRPSDIAYDPSGDVRYVTVGGGHLGHPLAHENEAPFPLRLVRPYLEALCPPGGTVLDPFLGSGTTAHAAVVSGRDFVGIDVRASQIDLTQRRLAEVWASLPAGSGPSIITVNTSYE